MSTSALINQILLKKPIIEYLEIKGYQPYKILSGGKIQYLCPFLDHEEQKPSFVVFTNSELENFYCFGCCRSWNIIHLVAGLENITFKEAVKRLGDGVEISLTEGVEIEVDRVYKDIEKGPEIQELESHLLSISSQCLAYLTKYPEELKLVDQVYASVDNDLLECAFDNIYDTSKSLGLMLGKRQDKIEIYRERKRKEDYQKGNK